MYALPEASSPVSVVTLVWYGTGIVSCIVVSKRTKTCSGSNIKLELRRYTMVGTMRMLRFPLGATLEVEIWVVSSKAKEDSVSVEISFELRPAFG